MKFTATIHPALLETLGPKEECEATLEELFQRTFWATTLPINRERFIKTEKISPSKVGIRLQLNQRDAEIVKDVLYETLLRFLEPEYDTDIDVEINDELETLTWSTT